jgi:hypothetical protein
LDRGTMNFFKETVMQAKRKFVSLTLPILLSAVTLGSAAPARAADADSEDQVAATVAADVGRAGDAKRHDPAEFAQKRLAKLKSQLRITPEQEAQWSAFSDSVMQQIAQMKAAHEARQGRPATAPERIDRQVERMKQGVARFEAMGQAAKQLYATLSPDQQQVADEKLLRWQGRHRG